MAGLKDGADLNGEGLAAVVALVGTDTGALTPPPFCQCVQRRRNAGIRGLATTSETPRMRMLLLRCESMAEKECGVAPAKPDTPSFAKNG